jgi:hypothetical protein
MITSVASESYRNPKIPRQESSYTHNTSLDISETLYGHSYICNSDPHHLSPRWSQNGLYYIRINALRTELYSLNLGHL